MAKPNGWYTRSEVAAMTGLTTRQVKHRMERGTIEYKFFDGTRYVPETEVERLRNGNDFDPARMTQVYDPYSIVEGERHFIPRPELWGDGKAKLVRPSTPSAWETVVFLSDIHVPYHDPVLVDAATQIIAAVNPDRVVINGDTNDFFGLSRFNKAAERFDELQNEINMGRMIRALVRESAPNAIMDETLGNHEERLLTYPGFNAPGLRTLDVLKPSNLLGLSEYEITLHPRNGFRLRENFLVEHGQVVRKGSGESAKARLNDTLISGIMGHTHRLDSNRRSGYRDLVWYEQGCLCAMNPDYVIGEANWKQGFAIGTFSTKTENFDVQLVPAVGRGFIFDGKHYGDTGEEPDVYTGARPTFEFNGIKDLERAPYDLTQV